MIPSNKSKMDMEMDTPLLRPTTPASTHDSSVSSTSSIYRNIKLGRSRLNSTHSSPFSHSKFPILNPQSSRSSSTSSSSQTFQSGYLEPSIILSRTRSIYTKLNTEVQFMKLKLSSRRKKGKRQDGRWVKIEGEGERRGDMVWRRMDGGQGTIPYGGVGRARLE